MVEATSGNTGIGLAIAAAIKGYRCIFTIPDKMSSEKIRLLRAFGAEVIVVPTAVPPDHPEYYITEGASRSWRRRRAPSSPTSTTTTPTPRRTTRRPVPSSGSRPKGKITHFVCSPGTGGTITGAGRYLKEKNPKIQIVAGDPVGSIYKDYAKTHEKGQGQPYKVEGIGGRQDPHLARLRSVVDEWMTVSDADAFRTARRLTREEGIFLGGSGGPERLLALWTCARRSTTPRPAWSRSSATPASATSRSSTTTTGCARTR